MVSRVRISKTSARDLKLDERRRIFTTKEISQALKEKVKRSRKK